MTDHLRSVTKMVEVPPDVAAHCASFKLCKGCPLGTCVAPLANYGDPRWAAWIEERNKTIRGLRA